MNLLGITGVGADHTLLVVAGDAEQALPDLPAFEDPGAAQHDDVRPAARAGGVRRHHPRYQRRGLEVRQDRLDARAAAERGPERLRGDGPRLRRVLRSLERAVRQESRPW